ncbi:Unannotated [Lentimonas sp. CC19]|nr:Unannotated [Lentimonas sp. CC19]CAA6697296.1 Unannotated [Lentimonas sp. CC10]CAA7070423.1 Unannotated [Lentimonas sp. CC11]
MHGWLWHLARFVLFHETLTCMNHEQPKNPLHGYTLEQIVISLSDYYGWDGLGGRIEIRCFNENPSVKSSLKFLRRTPWARKKVEELFVYTLEKYGTDEASEEEAASEGEG